MKCLLAVSSVSCNMGDPFGCSYLWPQDELSTLKWRWAMKVGMECTMNKLAEEEKKHSLQKRCNAVAGASREGSCILNHPPTGNLRRHGASNRGFPHLSSSRDCR